MTPRNPLDKKVIVDRELFRALYLLAKNASIGKLSDADAETCRELWKQELTGWAAVPVELTDDHINVAWLNIDDDLENKTLRNVHRAMLEASPPLPTGEKQ